MRSYSFRTFAAAALVLCAALVPTTFTRIAKAQAAPEPSLYPLSPELQFKYSAPKRIVVDVPGEPFPRPYWYITYTITNTNEKPYQFLPTFEMLTDEGKVLRSDRNVPKQVFEAIKTREGLRLLESSRQIEGDIQSGEDQARDGVAIWPEPMQRMGTFSIFAAGLSQEYVTLKKGADGKWIAVDPKKSAEELKGVDEKDILTMRKSLQITYQVLGDEVRPGDDPIVFKSKKWVMR